MTRQIVLDTETTGIGHQLGHRVIEIGCMELIDRQLTGEQFHCYLNPKRAVDDGAFRVHGLSNQFLQDKPLFTEILPDFLNFIGTSELIIHNAPFDLGFLNAELSLAKSPQRLDEYCSIFDTLVLARKLHPGQRNNLDALCKRYHIDNSKRDKHGALLDAQILAYVYLALTGGQKQLLFEDNFNKASNSTHNHAANKLTSTSPVYFATDDELKQHEDFMQYLLSSG